MTLQPNGWLDDNSSIITNASLPMILRRAGANRERAIIFTTFDLGEPWQALPSRESYVGAAMRWEPGPRWLNLGGGGVRGLSLASACMPWQQRDQ